MLYSAYQAQADAMEPLKLLSGLLSAPLRHEEARHHPLVSWRSWVAANDVFARLRLTHHRPPYEIGPVRLADGQEAGITEEAVQRTPFCTLLRFRKDREVQMPPVLLVAPMSGHFATLLRETVRTMLQDHDVYITDWHNARDVPLKAGRFGLDEYIDHLIRFLETIGPGAHLMAICQPCVPALAAAAVMAQDNHPAQPRSLALLAGPVDCRINPTAVNELATSKPYEWFEQKMIQTVPWRCKGAGRRVYPGYVQVSAFMSMNLERHLNAFHDLYRNLLDGQPESLQKAQATQNFYEEYFAVSDLPAEFYLDTIKRVFQDYDLARGELTWHGNKVEPEAMRRTALFTVEGERDDICSIGQTVAAQDLCSKVRPYMKNHHVQTGVGHYGVFSGRRWRNEIYPRLRDAIHAFA